RGGAGPPDRAALNAWACSSESLAGSPRCPFFPAASCARIVASEALMPWAARTFLASSKVKPSFPIQRTTEVDENFSSPAILPPAGAGCGAGLGGGSTGFGDGGGGGG